MKNLPFAFEISIVTSNYQRSENNIITCVRALPPNLRTHTKNKKKMQKKELKIKPQKYDIFRYISILLHVRREHTYSEI